MLGFLKGLFAASNSEAERVWQEQLAINRAAVFTPEPGLTEEQHKLAQACIVEFRALFGEAKPYRFDLRTFE